MSSEAHFCLRSIVNKQNFQYWAAENLHELHERPLYDLKVNVWCLVSSAAVIGPYLFEDEMGKPPHLHYITTLLWLKHFSCWEYRIFQGMRLCGFSKMVLQPTWWELAWLCITVCFHVGWFLILVVLWPHSPYLTALDFFLGGYLKYKVYGCRPADLDELKVRIH
jgi:hypothetical protein